MASNPKKGSRLVATIPNLFTLGNGICGFSAICSAAASFDPSLNAYNCLWWSALLIMAAMIFDALDGKVARMTGSTSDIGAELDSLSDAISFGVAPAFLVYRLCSVYITSSFLWWVAILYMGCAVWRLARFNVETEDHSEESHLWFTGLPSPAAAATVALGVLLYGRSVGLAKMLGLAQSVTEQVICYGIVAATAAVAVLMVSRLKVPHVLNHIFRKRKS